MNINEISVAYLEEKEQRRRASTVDGYRSSINLYILPTFGNCEIEAIEPETIQAWVDSFAKPGAAEKAFKCLRQLFNWAIRKYRLRIWNPTQGIELPAKPIYRPKTITANETAKRLRGFFGHKDEPTVIVGSTLALRPGENYGIMWDDINWKSGAVAVSRSRQYVRGKVVILPTKTRKSNRILYLPKFAKDRLHAIWVHLGKPKGFINPDNPQNISRRIKAFCERNKLPVVTMTNMRHSWATIAVEAGIAIETVAMFLGHSNIMTAYNHYIVPRKSIIKHAQSIWQDYLFEHAPKITNTSLTASLTIASECE